MTSPIYGQDIRELKLLRRLFPLIQELFVKAVREYGLVAPPDDFWNSLQTEEEYLRETLGSAGELLNACDQMSYSVEFLSGYRHREFQTGQPITRLDYIVYHLENHLIRTSSVLDRALWLVNTIFRLSLPVQECRFQVITHNQQIESTPTEAALRSIQSEINPYRTQRNLIVHQQGLVDEALKNIEPYYFFQKAEFFGLDNVVNPDFFHFSKSQTDNFVKSKKAELAEINEGVFVSVLELLDRLEPIFDHNYHLLQNNSS